MLSTPYLTGWIWAGSGWIGFLAVSPELLALEISAADEVEGSQPVSGSSDLAQCRHIVGGNGSGMLSIDLLNGWNNIESSLCEFILPDQAAPLVNNPLLDTGIPVQGGIPCVEGGGDNPVKKRVCRGMGFGMKVIDATGDLDAPVAVESHVGRQRGEEAAFLQAARFPQPGSSKLEKSRRL